MRIIPSAGDSKERQDRLGHLVKSLGLVGRSGHFEQEMEPGRPFADASLQLVIQEPHPFLTCPKKLVGPLPGGVEDADENGHHREDHQLGNVVGAPHR